MKLNITFIMTMKKLRLQKSRLVTLLLFVSAGIPTHAGGILTNTNQNVAFDRNFAREATMEIDGALTNPAGMAWIGEGWHLSFNWQSSFQNRNIDATFAPFMQNATSPADAEGNKRFNATIYKYDHRTTHRSITKTRQF